MLVTSSLAVLALIGRLGYLAVFAALHVLPTGYEPVRHAVSDYGVGRYGRLFTAAVRVAAAGGLALAAAVALEVGSPPLRAGDVPLLVALPIAQFAMSFVPTDLEGRRLTPAGAAHYLLAILSFTVTYMTIARLTPELRALYPGYLTIEVLGWAAAVAGPALALVVVTMVPRLRRVFGLTERVFLLTTHVWFLAMTALLLQLIFQG
jgi:hypothetical protein